MPLSLNLLPAQSLPFFPSVPQYSRWWTPVKNLGDFRIFQYLTLPMVSGHWGVNVIIITVSFTIPYNLQLRSLSF